MPCRAAGGAWRNWAAAESRPENGRSPRRHRLCEDRTSLLQHPAAPGADWRWGSLWPFPRPRKAEAVHPPSRPCHLCHYQRAAFLRLIPEVLAGRRSLADFDRIAAGSAPGLAGLVVYLVAAATAKHPREGKAAER